MKVKSINLKLLCFFLVPLGLFAQSKKVQIVLLKERVDSLIETNQSRDSTIIYLRTHIESINKSLEKQVLDNIDMQSKLDLIQGEMLKSKTDFVKIKSDLNEKEVYNTKLKSDLNEKDVYNTKLNRRIDSLLNFIYLQNKNIDSIKSNIKIVKEPTSKVVVAEDPTNKKNIKHYNGYYHEYNPIFHINKPSSGDAKYDYYENSHSERILHGSFTFISNYTVIGSYKNGAKNGLWKITSTTPFKSYARKNAVTEIITANYFNGMLNGLCEYKMIEQNTNKILLHSKANFKNNIQIGKYEFIGYTDFWQQENSFNFKVNYETDSLGNYNGSYMVTYEKDKIKYEDKREYQNGMLIYKLHRDISTGNILFRFQDGQIYDSEAYYLFPNDVKQAINFWVCCQVEKYPCVDCGCRNNPLYIVSLGIESKNLELNLNRK